MTAEQVRSVPVVDQLDRDGERLVLLPERAVRLVGLAPALLDLSRDWTDVARLVEQLEERFGVPAAGEAADLVREAVDDLAAQGLIELSGHGSTPGEGMIGP
ncbi:hypothetical protein D9V37_15960 [Nocardioides mangrovicus]|uniref:PqqD family protein n=1 Tax=Nocardioides mangrovicus TaxID=2478913 RepID=A0A3L8NWW5_9ACTN|nr:PqqD family peptide modification chaperone [Nocardioides mangrovicus]RLV47655.1 hypothetical protein D9V37_15960 [Nocardioides mangrovicus]